LTAVSAEGRDNNNDYVVKYIYSKLMMQPETADASQNADPPEGLADKSGDIQPPMPLEEKMALSLQTYTVIKTKLTERYGKSMINEMPDTLADFWMEWFPKNGARRAKLTVMVNTLGGLRIEFTRNTVEGISSKKENPNHVEIRLNDGTRLTMKNLPDLPFLRAHLFPEKKYHPRKSTQQFAIDLVDTVLMA